MSFLERVRQAMAAPAMAAGQVRPLSPNDDVNHLWEIVAGDWHRPTTGANRTAAMAVPAVKRARGIVCSTIGRMPLRAYTGDQLAAAQPTWLDRTDGPMSPYHRMVWTVDDLFFYGWSAWAVARGAAGQVIAADRVPFDSWRYDGGRFVYISPEGVETIADPATVVLIPGSDEGLLNSSPAVVNHAADLLLAPTELAMTHLGLADVAPRPDWAAVHIEHAASLAMGLGDVRLSALVRAYEARREAGFGE